MCSYPEGLAAVRIRKAYVPGLGLRLAVIAVPQAQLGDVLGLSPMDVGSVHSKLAEESFRHQVQAVMGDGIVNKERMDALAGAPRCLRPVSLS